jgi:hypothetical protein
MGKNNTTMISNHKKQKKKEKIISLAAMAFYFTLEIFESSEMQSARERANNFVKEFQHIVAVSCF